MVSEEIKKIILKFAKILQERNIKIDKIILYGSHARGKIHEDSDIDVAIVSPDFGKDPLEERKLLFRLAWRVDPRLEPIPLSLTTWEKTWVPLIYEIRYNGIELELT